MEFESPMGRTFINTEEDEDSFRTFSVPDDSKKTGQPQQLTPEEAMALRQQFAQQYTKKPQQKSNNTFNVDIKKQVEFLTGMMRGRKDVPLEVNGHKAVFSLRTLKGREKREYANMLQQLKFIAVGTEHRIRHTDLIDLRKTALKHALFAIDGIALDVLLGVAEDSTLEENKLLAIGYFLDELDDAVLEFLYVEFEKLTKEHSDTFGIKNEQEAKEVAEAVRKSS